ncbi:MAG TPA: hypothetical protein ENI27_10365, partial [bacterium]|nr:hypothetical protein [bacterium]
QGFGKATNQPCSTENRWYVEGLQDIPQDLDEAKRLMKEAGYEDGVDVQLITVGSVTELVMLSQIYQYQLKEIGINVVINAHDEGTWFDRLENGDFDNILYHEAENPDYDTFFTTWALPDEGYHSITGSGKGYDNPQMTEWIYEARRLNGFDQRKAIYAKALQLMIDENPMMVLVGYSNPYGYQNYVKGWEVKTNQMIRWREGGTGPRLVG